MKFSPGTGIFLKFFPGDSRGFCPRAPALVSLRTHFSSGFQFSRCETYFTWPIFRYSSHNKGSYGYPKNRVLKPKTWNSNRTETENWGFSKTEIKRKQISLLAVFWKIQNQTELKSKQENRKLKFCKDRQHPWSKFKGTFKTKNWVELTIFCTCLSWKMCI